MRRGAVAIFVVVVIFFLIFLSFMAQQISLIQVRQSNLRLEEEKAYYVAQGALHLTILQPDIYQLTEQKKSGYEAGGTYTTIVKPIGENLWEVISAGQVQKSKKVLKLRVKQTLLPDGTKRLDWQYEE